MKLFSRRTKPDLVELVHSEFQGHEVTVKTSRALLNRLPEDIPVSGLVQELTDELEHLPYSSFSPDKSQKPLSNIDLFLYAYSEEAESFGFSEQQPVEVSISPPAALEFQANSSGWQNYVVLLGEQGTYSCFIHNGFYNLQ